MDVADIQFVRARDGLRLAYQVIGEGSPDIVLLPAVSCIDLMWEEPSFAHALTRIARIGRLIVFDIRGFGSSDPVPVGKQPTAEVWMEDVNAVLDAVGSLGAVVIANSVAGLFAMLFAATYPDRTSALVLINTTPNYIRDEETPLAPYASQEIEAIARGAEQAWGTGAGVDVLAPSRGNDPSFRRWHARVERLALSATEFADRIRWIYQFDMRPFLPSIQAPTLVMNRRSRVNPNLAQARYMADHIPNAQLVVPSGVDGLFFSEDADELIDDIEEFITGVRPISEPDRTLATVLFTDIVNSTQKQAELGDARWKQVLNQHDDLVRRELDRHRGKHVNTTGDGVLATFDGPARAIRCTQEIIKGIGGLGLEVRAGLHTGEVELRGDDVTGLAVVIGQRVSALAGAGEVLVSSTVVDLVAGSGLEFDDRGEHELKGVGRPWRVFAVRP
jgi:class 3 adenylate cyclase